MQAPRPANEPLRAAPRRRRRIRQLAKEHDKKVYAFAEDVAASGGYMLMCAGDRLFAGREPTRAPPVMGPLAQAPVRGSRCADPSSLVGSVGVVGGGFGFVEAIQKLGVERRLLTAGKHKAPMDPFLVRDSSSPRLRPLTLPLRGSPSSPKRTGASER